MWVTVIWITWQLYYEKNVSFMFKNVKKKQDLEWLWEKWSCKHKHVEHVLWMSLLVCGLLTWYRDVLTSWRSSEGRERGGGGEVWRKHASGNQVWFTRCSSLYSSVLYRASGTWLRGGFVCTPLMSVCELKRSPVKQMYISFISCWLIIHYFTPCFFLCKMPCRNNFIYLTA